MCYMYVIHTCGRIRYILLQAWSCPSGPHHIMAEGEDGIVVQPLCDCFMMLLVLRHLADFANVL